MSSLGLVVPTRGDRPYLPAIIEACGLPAERIAVVLTADAEVDLPATVVRDRGPVNIQRWWNAGIAALGAEHVLILNDDVTIPEGLVEAMSEQLDRDRAAMCFSYGNTPQPILTGWAFMLDLSTGIRPDERFRWYYGDDDLRQQALRLGGITSVGLRAEHHHPGESTNATAELRALATEDQVLFGAKWEAC